MVPTANCMFNKWTNFGWGCFSIFSRKYQHVTSKLFVLHNQRRAIQYEFEPVGPTLLKNPLGARWGLLLTLRWVGSWLPIYLASLSHQVERRFDCGNRTANHSIRIWILLHNHLVVHGHLGSKRMTFIIQL